MPRKVLPAFLIITAFLLLTATVGFTQPPSQKDLDRLKEEIKQEILQQLKSGEAATPETSPSTTVTLTSEEQELKERIKKELLQELSAEHEKAGDLRQALRRDVSEALRSGDGFLAKAVDGFTLDLLVETGVVFESTKFRNGDRRDRSSFAVPTVELALGFHPLEWAGAEAVLLYEDPPFDDESSLDLDSASITLGNPEKFPFFLTAGVLYVPFGALYTHLPDDPLVDLPLTLSLGETREAALLVGAQWRGLSFSAYGFNGDVNEEGDDDHINSFGFDTHYHFVNPQAGLPEFTIGASYISNLADSGGITDALPTRAIRRSVGGFDGYFHADYRGFFLLGEYMTALRSFSFEELPEKAGSGAQPSVWTVEGGYAFEWWNTLEIVLHYGGSREGGALGLPERRLGIGFNQTLYPGVVFSMAYLRDTYHDNDVDERDDRNLVLSQLSFTF